MSSSLLLPQLLLSCSLFYGQCATISISPGGTAFQDALDEVNPGDVIELGHGDYWEDLKTRTDGTADMPITIRGAGGMDDRENVVLRGDGTSSRVLEIKHDYYIIEDFTVDGDSEDDPNRDSNSDSAEDLWRDILIYAIADREPTERDGGYISTLDGLVIRNMKLANAGGECIRLRDHVTRAEVHHNNITDCGIYDFRMYGDGKNGEGLYVGTASDQWEDGPDVCKGNIIRNNYIRTRGNEGIDVKEGSVDTVIEYNEVHMQYDKESGGIGSRGDRSIIRFNHIQDTDGSGVRLGGHIVDDIEYGANNQVYENTMVDCRHSAVKVMVDPQGQICDNEVTLPDNVDEDDYDYSGGAYYYDPLIPCESSPTPVTEPTPATSPTTEPPTTESPTTEPPTTEPPTTEPPTTEPPTTEPPTTESPTTESPMTESPTMEPTPEPTPEPGTGDTCSDGIEGIDGNGVVCCPLGCGQCGGTGCSSAGAANGLNSGSCCGGGIKYNGDYCDDTGEAPCIYGSAPENDDDEGGDDEGDDDSEEDDDGSDGTCSDGIEGIDGNGVVCCPLGCDQCGGKGCFTAGAANGLDSGSCCKGSIKDSGSYCDDTGEAPCIYGSAPDV
ncbi:unnamed protein product [Ectocarpus sp. 13 AM-2016]